MSVVLGVSGWLLAVTGIGAAAAIRIRLARHAEAVARACHEVRGPLTAVRLGLELGARLRQLSQTRLRALELELGRAAVALDDLSAARVARAAEPPFALEPVDMVRLAATSVEAWAAVAAAQGGSVLLGPPAGPLLVAGQRLRLAQAVGNLLANAIEHGGGDVEVRLGGGAETIRVEVLDGGSGLPAPIDELIRRRGHGRGRRGHGLRIVSAVAKAHGGRLTTAPSTQGARLVLELPRAGEVQVPGQLGASEHP